MTNNHQAMYDRWRQINNNITPPLPPLPVTNFPQQGALQGAPQAAPNGQGNASGSNNNEGGNATTNTIGTQTDPMTQESHGGGSGVSGMMKTMHHKNHAALNVNDGNGTGSQTKTFRIFLTDNSIYSTAAQTGSDYNAWSITNTGVVTQVAPGNLLFMQKRNTWTDPTDTNWSLNYGVGPIEQRLIVPNGSKYTEKTFDIPKDKNGNYYAIVQTYHNTPWFNVPLNNIKNYVDDCVWIEAFRKGATKYRFKSASVKIHGYYPQSQYVLGGTNDFTQRQYSNGHLIVATPKGWQWPTDNPNLDVDTFPTADTYKAATRFMNVDDMNNAQPTITFTGTTLRERKQFGIAGKYQGPYKNTLIPVQIPINFSTIAVEDNLETLKNVLDNRSIDFIYKDCNDEKTREQLLQSIDTRGDTFHIMDSEDCTHNVDLGNQWVNLADPGGQGVTIGMSLKIPTNVDYQNSTNAQTFNINQYRNAPIAYEEGTVNQLNTGDRAKRNIDKPVSINPLYVKIARHPQDVDIKYFNQAYLNLTYSCEIEFEGPNRNFGYDSKIVMGSYDEPNQTWFSDAGSQSVMYNAVVKSKMYDLDNNPKNIHRPNGGQLQI